MSKLVLGLKLLKNNILANVIVTFQIIAVIILCWNMISLFDLLFMCSDKLEKIKNTGGNAMLTQRDLSIVQL